MITVSLSVVRSNLGEAELAVDFDSYGGTVSVFISAEYLSPKHHIGDLFGSSFLGSGSQKYRTNRL